MKPTDEELATLSVLLVDCQDCTLEDAQKVWDFVAPLVLERAEKALDAGGSLCNGCCDTCGLAALDDAKSRLRALAKP